MELHGLLVRGVIRIEGSILRTASKGVAGGTMDIGRGVGGAEDWLHNSTQRD